MCEVLFKGKRMDNGEWVEGFYFERKDTMGRIIEAVILKDAYEQITNGQRYLRSNTPGECYRVDSSTVCQYIGLTDKNNNRIFEGDVVDCGHGCVGYQKIEVVEYNGGGFNPFAVPRWECTPSPNDVIVTGNIYDNPELLRRH